MAYLHENREEFENAVNLASKHFHILPVIVEKDYYVTMILRKLSEDQGFVVFKGGTSLSKCHKVIKRFSEDIDITIDSKLSQGQMKNLKASMDNRCNMRICSQQFINRLIAANDFSPDEFHRVEGKYLSNLNAVIFPIKVM